MRFVRTWAAATLLPMALAGCDGLDLAGLTAGTPSQSLALLSGEFTVRGPANYCVDTRSSRASDGFAILAPCSVLTGEGALPRVSAVITVQVGDPGSALVRGGESALAEFLRQPEGAVLLSPTGAAANIKVRSAVTSENRVAVLFDDKGASPIAGTQNEEWRVFTDIKGRLLTISLRGLTAAPAAIDAKEALLDQVVGAIAQANATDAGGEG